MFKRVKLAVKMLKDPASREQFRLALLRRMGRAILPGYRFQWPEMEWFGDKEFNQYLERFGERDGLNTHRRWTLYQLTRLAASVPGDTVECGVFEGAGSYLISRSLGSYAGGRRTHFVFDSFEGLSAPSAADSKFWQQGNLACSLERAKKKLESLDNISWHPGWIPQRFQDVADRQFAFVHIDVDLYEPTRDSMRFFYPRVNSGGIIVCDDYGFLTCPGATQAVDEFLADKPEKMIYLPCGGGFFIKGCKTAAKADLQRGTQ